MYKQIVFALLITSIFAITQTGGKQRGISKDDTQQVNYQRAAQMIKSGFAFQCPGAGGYTWVSGSAIDYQIVNGVNYTYEFTVQKNGDKRKYRATVYVPATSQGRGQISGCSQVFG